MRIPEWLHGRLWRWSLDYRERHPKPDFIIGGAADPYLKRWWVIPRNPLFNVYLHEFWRSDDDRALHDHPWVNVSIVLMNAYTEMTPAGAFFRSPRSITLRRPKAAHRVVLSKYLGKNIIVTTLFITGPRVREWGFWCPRGWVHWRKFTNPATQGATVGRGCE